MITRRAMLGLLGCSASVLERFAGRSAFGMLPQGVSSRGVKPQPAANLRAAVCRALHGRGEGSGAHAAGCVGGLETKNYIIEVVGCGVAFLDYDNDGWLDLFVLSGSRIEGSPPGTTNRLYQNNRNGTFADVTEKAGLKRDGWASAVTIGDYDNDGFDDLFITYYGHNVLYRNNGDGTFTDVTKKAGLHADAVRYCSGCTWIDFDRDGHLDLFVATYLNTTLDKLPKPGENADCRWKGVPVNCGPRGLPTGSAQLFRNNGDGTFRVSRQSGIAAHPRVSDDGGCRGLRQRRMARHLRRVDSTPSWLFHNRATAFREGLGRASP